jgi:hypothetical protein
MKTSVRTVVLFVASALSVVFAQTAARATSATLPGSVVAIPKPLISQAANLKPSVIYTAPAASHYYQVCLEIDTTRPASASSTLPQPQVDYTSAVDGAVKVANIGFSSGLTGNATFVANVGCANVYVKSSTPIYWATTNYASVGSKPMQYALSGSVQLIK